MKRFDINHIPNKEYLLTNGLGGYCYGGLDGQKHSTYHALLNASLNPPVNRLSILGEVREVIQINNQPYPLDSQFLLYTETDNTVSFHYIAAGIAIVKTISMVHQQNTIAIKYNITNSNTSAKLIISPILTLRNHSTVNKKAARTVAFSYQHDVKIIPMNYKDILISMHLSDGVFTNQEKVFSYFYPNDKKRGEEAYDQGISPGYWTIMIPSYTTKEISMICSIEDQYPQDANQIINNEIKRLDHLSFYGDSIMKRLAKTADQFIVKRASTKNYSVIAGYPWFTDWGRDTLISLEGLTLVTGRYDVAKSIIRNFSSTLKNGLAVNMFPDNNKPIYNTVDASLWLIHCCYKYLLYTRDERFILQEMYPLLNTIISSYIEGTDHEIYLDDDFLLHAGKDEDQITWMDVRIDGKAVTPRHGKVVEINALWYHCLKIMNYFSRLTDHNPTYDLLADKTKQSFINKFYDQSRGYLLDVADPDDDSFRPNQLYAIALDFNVLPIELAKPIVKKIKNRLYIGKGLRSLDPSDKRYQKHYQGDLKTRDKAYHQGTSWGFLIGPFLRACLKCGYSHKEVLLLLMPLIESMDEGCINCINEIFDGDAPYTPRGAVNQAWSIAEVLCIYHMIK